jgi:protein gp37
MGDKTGISWTTSTWNPIRGCTRVSPGCGGPGPHGGCYAETIAARFSGPGMPYEGLAEVRGGKPRWTGEVRLVEEHLLDPIRKKRPRKFFVNSRSDLAHEKLSDEVIDKVFAVMALAPQHEYQVLTKRTGRMAAYLSDAGRDRKIARAIIDMVIAGMAVTPRSNADYDARWPVVSEGDPEDPSDLRLRQWPLPHVLIGASVEDQQRADERCHDMAKIADAGWRTFVSYEPALGPVDWRGWSFLKWLISGAESGSQRRLDDEDWHRAARDFCVGNGIAYFYKQTFIENRKVETPELDGRRWTQFPS